MQNQAIKVKTSKFKIPERCLVVMPNYIGDCVLLTAFLRNLKLNFFKTSKLHIVASDPISKMLATNPYVDNIFIKENILDVSGFLKRQGYDTCILLDFSLKWQFSVCTNTTINQKVIPDLKRLNTNSHLVFNKFFNYVLENTPLKDKTPQIDVYMSFLKQLGLNVFDKKVDIPLTQSDIQKAQKVIQKTDKKKIFLHFSASIQSKQWPKPYWKQVIEHIKSQDIYIIGNQHPPKDLLFERVKNLCCKTDLRQTIALLKKADIIITTDSAPAHLAAIAKTPNIIVLYGPTNYHQWKPYSKKSNVIQLYVNVPCNPCRLRSCQSLKCIKSLTPSMVIREVDKILNAKD